MIEICHILKTNVTIYNALFWAYLKYIPDNNEKMNTEFPPQRIPQLIMHMGHSMSSEPNFSIQIPEWNFPYVRPR
jgi:hypothetical protein